MTLIWMHNDLSSTPQGGPAPLNPPPPKAQASSNSYKNPSCRFLFFFGFNKKPPSADWMTLEWAGLGAGHHQHGHESFFLF